MTKKFSDSFPKNSTAGFTLIEVVIYIALFSILLVGVFTMLYQLSGTHTNVDKKITEQEESDFVMRKIEWALTGLSTTTSDIVSPSKISPYPTSTVLSIQKINFGEKIPVIIMLNEASSSIMMQTGNAEILPITTENVQVTKLEFRYIPPTSLGTRGIAVNVTIGGLSFSIVTYPLQ